MNSADRVLAFAPIGAWPENGVCATQLGPNRKGRPS